MPTGDTPYDWYSIVEPDAQVQQGDFFYNLPIITPTSKIVDVDLNAEAGSTSLQEAGTIVADCIVLTHSCDFQDNTPDDYQVVLCPIFAVSKTESENRYIPRGKWGNFVKDRVIDTYLLNKFEPPEEGMGFFYQLIDLKVVYTVPYSVIKIQQVKQGKRVRLMPPYREHLAQAFARRFMRVGLPQVLPEERPY